MGFYDKHVMPTLVGAACGSSPIRRQREKVVPHANGRVLEVGVGPGLNLPHYDAAKVEHLWALEPNTQMRKKAAKRVDNTDFSLEWLDLSGEEIPLDKHSVDTVVLTYTLCTISDWQAALAQMKRVMKPGAKLLFCEHGAAPDAAVQRWQRRLNPAWKALAGGCHLNRDIPALLREGGFVIQQMHSSYLPKSPRFASYNYWGYAL